MKKTNGVLILTLHLSLRTTIRKLKNYSFMKLWMDLNSYHRYTKEIPDCILRLGIFGNFAPGYSTLISGGILESRKLPLLRKSYTHCMIFQLPAYQCEPDRHSTQSQTTLFRPTIQNAVIPSHLIQSNVLLSIVKIIDCRNNHGTIRHVDCSWQYRYTNDT